ncbi:ABC transporter permease [Solwaraspora sp. WMMD1047]|uniref:ABC transporter permease n=1 Tax=Solwaraspora sp. WMMD1047 TaxID=3016102 RepID=UPI0024166E95|nr:ABC transporter permease [Solwaraspora sp. WMMD1047]MDG4834319.1 ABC transporter permease [Solwaraspora sp. WMMD1047]
MSEQDRSTNLVPRGFGIAWTAAVVVFILAPFVVMLLMSFTGSPFLSYPWEEGGFSLRWYTAFFDSPAFLDAFVDSLLLAVITSVVTLAVASLASLAIVRYAFRLRNALNLLLVAPLFVPHVMIALALLIYTSSVLDWGSGLRRMLVAHVVITLPFAIATISAALTGFDRNQEYAAYDLGAGRWRTLLTITLPQVKAGFFAAAVMAFVVSFDNVAVSLFMVGPRYSSLPVEIYSFAIEEISPLAPAAAMVMTFFSLVAIIAIERSFGVQRLLGTGANR